MVRQRRNDREDEFDGIVVVTPAAELLLAATELADWRTWRVLGGEADLAGGLARASRQMLWQPNDVRERLAFVADGSGVVLEEPGTTHPKCEAVVFAAPSERDLARRWLLLARESLTQGGRLYVCGANAEGIRSALSDGRAIFGDPVHEAYGRKQRLGIFSRAESYPELPSWAVCPGVQPGTWEPFSAELGGRMVEFVTQAGVFAGAKVDAGTRLLLDSLPDLAGASVLDVGCGAGVIGVAARIAGAARVDMVDANLLAVQAAEENTRRLGLSECTAKASDVFPDDDGSRYDLIVSNPPFHRGKVVDYAVADRLIDEAPLRLASGGSLLVVANAFLAYDRRMRREFRTVETIDATRQYRVIRASDPIGTA